MNDLNPKAKYTIIESGAIYRVTDLCQWLQCEKNVMLVYDKITKSISGDKIYSELSGKYDVHTFTISDADIENVHGAVAEIERTKSDIIFGIGGGRPIDVAKLSSHYAGKRFVSVPTACSHDGIASERASIIDNGMKTSKKAHAPVGVLADTSIIVKSPHETFTAGIADLISNVTAVADWYLAKKNTGEEVNECAANQSLLAASYMIDDADNIKSKTEPVIRDVIYNLINSGKAMQLAKSSRPASGFEHKISHALDQILESPKMHGHQCGIGTLFSAAAHEKYDKPCTYNFSQIAGAFKKMKIPKTLKELGIPRDKFIEAINMTPKISDRYTIYDAAKIDIEALLDEIKL